MKQKVKGISLIVLVITIIIIIILAGAVILSLSNSNVINKAKSGIMQTDVSTIKEQIKTKMAENELNSVNTKIGTQLWTSYYTMSVSQLQDIGITTKTDCIYNYTTGELVVKQNNEYVTPEELYGKDTTTNYIDGYVKIAFGDEEVTDADISAATTTTAKAALQKQQLAQKYTNGEIKIELFKEIGDPVSIGGTETASYTTTTTNTGYFILKDIAPGDYAVWIYNGYNTLPFIAMDKDGVNIKISIAADTKKTAFTKDQPLKLYQCDYFPQDGAVEQGDFDLFATVYGKADKIESEIKIYDASKDGIVDVNDYNYYLSMNGKNLTDFYLKPTSNNI